MSKKFLYGYDVNTYIDMAIEKMKYLYPWATKEMFNKSREYRIEKINNEYEYVCIHKYNQEEDKKVLDVDAEGFIDYIIDMESTSIEWANEVEDVFVVPGGEDKVNCGWYLERYEIRKHKLGGYSVFVQAGDRTTGGSRTFFIPNDYFNNTYYEFLDKYIALVPPSFGFTKEELQNADGLSEFLGF